MSKMRACMFLAGLMAVVSAIPFELALAETGHASWYALRSRTASGEMMNPAAMTAAHRSLPFGTQVRVENLNNGRSVVVRINDRGPFVHGRIIDVSKAAASNLGMLGSGTANVRISTAGRGGANVAKKAVRGGMGIFANSGMQAKQKVEVAAERSHSLRSSSRRVVDASGATSKGSAKKQAVKSDRNQPGIFGGIFSDNDKKQRVRVARD